MSSPLSSAPARRLELHLSYECGQRCAFCSEADRMRWFSGDGPTGDEAVAALERMRLHGFDHLTITGGEPTLHPDLPRVLARAKKLGYRTYLTTNGARLSQPAYAERVLPLLDEVCVSLHGPDARTHDGLADRPGGFSAAVAALWMAARRGIFALTNTVVTRATAAAAPRTVALAASLGSRHCLLSNVAPEGRAESGYERLTPRLGVWRSLAATAQAAAAAGGAVLRVFGVPLCALGDRAEVSNDLYFSPRVTLERGPGPYPFDEVASPTPRRRRLQPECCSGCAARERCGGVFDRYLAAFGEAELAPVGSAPA